MTSQDPIITGLVTAMCSALIEKSKNRYNACKNNGQRGGRPNQFDKDNIMKLHEQGLSHKEIADKLGCSKKTVQRKLDDEDEI